MSNSKLATYTNISPNKTSPRNHAIDTITIHCYVGQVTAKQGCDYLAGKNVGASANYVVGKDGSIGQGVDEADRSWCTSSGSNDHRAVTIEVASDNKPPYAVTDAAYNALIQLVADICQRNGIAKLVWSTNKTDRINHSGGCNMTVHRDYANKDCPGEYLYSRHGDIANQVNAILGASTATASGETVYTVAKGDTLATIAAKYGTTYQALAAYNRIGNPNKITVGQKITIPSTGSGANEVMEEPEVAKMTQAEFNRMFKTAMEQYRAELQDNDCGDWSAEARRYMIDSGLMVGSGTVNGQPNYMWGDFLTREQLAVVMQRFAQKMGQA